MPKQTSFIHIKKKFARNYQNGTNSSFFISLRPKKIFHYFCGHHANNIKFFSEAKKRRHWNHKTFTQHKMSSLSLWNFCKIHILISWSFYSSNRILSGNIFADSIAEIKFFFLVVMLTHSKREEKCFYRLVESNLICIWLFGFEETSNEKEMNVCREMKIFTKKCSHNSSPHVLTRIND